MDSGAHFTLQDLRRNLRRLRKARGYSQEGFALASGIDRSNIGGVERRDRNPSLSMVLKIASALGTESRDLFEPLP